MVLRDAARPGSLLVVDRPVQDWGEMAVWLTTAKLWGVGLWRSEGQLRMTLEATSPDRRRWRHGCQRRWLEDGGVVEPLELLSAQERQQLHERLLRAAAMPPLAMCPLWTPSPVAEKDAANRRSAPGKGKGGRKRKPSTACQKS